MGTREKGILTKYILKPFTLLIVSGILYSLYTFINYINESYDYQPPVTLSEDWRRMLVHYEWTIAFGALAIGTFIFAYFVKKTYWPKKELGYIRSIRSCLFIVAILPLVLQLIFDIYYRFIYSPTPHSSPGGGGYKSMVTGTP